MLRRCSMASAEIDLGRLRSATRKSGLVGSGSTIASYSDPMKAAWKASRELAGADSKGVGTTTKGGKLLRGPNSLETMEPKLGNFKAGLGRWAVRVSIVACG